MSSSSGAGFFIDRSTSLLQQEAKGIVQYLRRKRAASERRDEEARDLLVGLLRVFGGEVEQLRQLARRVESEHLARPKRPRELGQAIAALSEAGKQFYGTSRADVELIMPATQWPQTRVLLEEIGSEHVDVLYLRSLRHDFGHLVKGSFAEHRGDLEHVQEILVLGDQLIAAVAAVAKAISNRETLR